MSATRKVKPIVFEIKILLRLIVFRRVVKIGQTFVERFAVGMNAVAEIVSGLRFISSLKLSQALCQSIARFDGEKAWNTDNE